MSQSTKIRNHLQAGKTLTSIQALDKFGCWRLAARIGELRQRGMEIHTIIIERGNKSYAKYKMA